MKAALLAVSLFITAPPAFAADHPANISPPQSPVDKTDSFADGSYPALTLAQVESGPVTPPAAAPDAGGSERKGRPEGWQWRRASGLEYTGIGLLTLGAVVSEAKFKPRDPKWTTHNAFDETFRDLLRVNDRDVRRKLYSASDVLMGVMIAAPEVESFITLGLRDRNWDATWQTNAINLESFVFTSFVASVTQNAIARQRPFVRDCSANGDCDFGMENRSMPSGHTAFAFTGAGLICTHHKFQALYRNETADDAACYTALGIASADGVLRILADSHYTSDVLVGAGLGLFSGFVLPRVLHYSWPLHDRTDGTEKKDGVRKLTVAPQLLSGGGGLGVDLTF